MACKKNRRRLSSNISWTIQKGSWSMHIVLTTIFAFFFSQILGSNVGLQITVMTYNLLSFIFFHWIVGDPFTMKYKQATFWEQMASQLEESSSLIFMAIYPILLFLLINRLVEWNLYLFIFSFISLVFVVIPKLGFMHMKRVFGIKRYD